MGRPRKYFTPEAAHEGRKANWRKWNRLRKERSERASAAMLAARDAVPPPATLGQILLGDPPPGRSALDRMRETA